MLVSGSLVSRSNLQRVTVSSQNPKLFISYRRKDSAYAALQIYDRIIDEFGEGSVEFDVNTVPPGVTVSALKKPSLNREAF